MKGVNERRNVHPYGRQDLNRTLGGVFFVLLNFVLSGFRLSRKGSIDLVASTFDVAFEGVAEPEQDRKTEEKRTSF